MNPQSQKLVFISMTNYSGGAESILLMIANATNSPLIFLKRLFASSLQLNNDQKVKYLTKRWLFIGFLMLIKELHHYRKGYIIISTHPYLNAYLGFLKRIGYLKSNMVVRECTSVFTRYSGLKKLSYQIAYKLGYPAVNLVVCQTQIMRDQLLEHNKFISQNSVIVLENPFDLNLVKQKARELINDEDLKTNFICAAGRLIPEKGFSILIKAFANIALQHKNLKLLILGEGQERNNLIRLIKALNLENRVILKGHLDNPVPYFKKARLCIVSSIKEGFPNVLLQMMAVNSSVVSTLCAGGVEKIPAIIKAKVDDIDALTKAITLALLADKYESSAHLFKTEMNTVQAAQECCHNTKELRNNYSVKNNQMDDYFKNRTPEIFIKSILKRLL